MPGAQVTIGCKFIVGRRELSFTQTATVGDLSQESGASTRNFLVSMASDHGLDCRLLTLQRKTNDAEIVQKLRALASS